MRPDPWKKAASKRYQSKQKAKGSAEGSTTASEKQQKPPPKNAFSQPLTPTSTTSKTTPEKTTAEATTIPISTRSTSSKYSRRKIVSNAFRFSEPLADDGEVNDGDTGSEEKNIRQQANQLQKLLETKGGDDFDPGNYFRFFEEMDLNESVVTNEEDGLDSNIGDLLTVDIKKIALLLNALPRQVRLGIQDIVEVQDLEDIEEDFDGEEAEMEEQRVPETLRLGALIVQQDGRVSEKDSNNEESKAESVAVNSKMDEKTPSITVPKTMESQLTTPKSEAMLTRPPIVQKQDAEEFLDELLGAQTPNNEGQGVAIKTVKDVENSGAGITSTVVKPETETDTETETKLQDWLDDLLG